MAGWLCKSDAVTPRAPSSIRGRSAHLGQIGRFLVTGGLSFAVDFGGLVLLREVLGWPLPWATTGAFLAAFAVNFGLNAGWVFGAHDRLATRLVRYLALVGVNYLVTIVVVVLLAAVGLWYTVAKVVAVGICLVLNFWAYRSWVYA